MNLEGCIVYQKNYRKNYKEPVDIVVLDILKNDGETILVKLTKDVEYGWTILDHNLFDKKLIKQLNEKHVDFEFYKTKFWWISENGFTTNKNFMKEDYEVLFYIKSNRLLKNE